MSAGEPDGRGPAGYRPAEITHQREADAFEIRKRAERRLGQIMEETPKAKNRYSGSVAVPLEKQGIDKHLADRARTALLAAARRWLGKTPNEGPDPEYHP
jgi:hypothetical protein